MPGARSGNPRVFFDVTIGDTPAGQIVFELFADKCPKTAENFRALCTGENRNEIGKRLWYKGCNFHSIIPDWVCVGGDIENNNGTGGLSIYGKFFEDENFDVKHDRPGLLSMMNFKNNTNNSQFVINLKEAPSLDNQNVVFGQVVTGMNTIEKMAKYGSKDGRVSCPIVIAECGQLKNDPVAA